MIISVLLSLGLAVPLSDASPNQVAEHVYRRTSRLVIIEYSRPKINSISELRGEGDPWLDQVAKRIDLDLAKSDDYVAFSLKWLPGRLRILDNYAEWSEEHEEPKSGIEKSPKGWKFKLTGQDSISVRELRRRGVIKFSEASPWFLNARFVIRTDQTSSDVLLDAISDCLGAKVVMDGENKLLSVDAKPFVKRRLSMAREQMRRYPPPFRYPAVDANELDFVSAKIESLALPWQPAKTIESLFNLPSNILTLSTKEHPDLRSAILEKLKVLNRSVQGTPPKIADGAMPFLRLGGNGIVGGTIDLENGSRLHF